MDADIFRCSVLLITIVPNYKDFGFFLVRAGKWAKKLVLIFDMRGLQKSDI